MFGLEDVLSNLFEKAPEDTQVTANRERERERERESYGHT